MAGENLAVLNSIAPDVSGSRTPGSAANGPGPYDADYRDLITEDPEKKIEREREDEETSKETKITTEEQEEESEEVKEGSEKESEEDEEEIDTSKIPFHRPQIKEIKAEFPEFFKKFPQVRDAIFREAEFSQIFPTVDDAKEAFESNQAFETLSDAALAGNAEPIIDSLQKTDEKALETFAASFLPTLYKRNQELYSTIVTPLFENLLRHIYKSSDENMKNSAINIADFLFGQGAESSLKGEKSFSKNFQVSEEQKKLQEERDLRTAESFRSCAGFVSDEANKAMRALVLKDFDPEKVFTTSIRNMLVDEVVKKIDEQLAHDNGHKAIMSAAWKRAKNKGYSDDEKSKLIHTYLARAKSLIPSVRDKVRSSALGKETKRVEDRREKIERVQVKKEVIPSQSHLKNGSDHGKKDYSKMSDLDILNS